MRCRVCHSDQVIFIADYQPYKDYKTKIYDCTVCDSRFSRHDSEMHELLHRRPSPYIRHKKSQSRVLEYRDNGDVEGLKGFLEVSSANKFIIDKVNHLGPSVNILEMGCSRGYMTAYFLATGRQILGVDISSTAIDAARKCFGDYFCIVGDPTIREKAPYDVIYHVGTIGCVGDPEDFTLDLISMLKPGGVLLFNAPNREFCEAARSLWLSTPPPDLVTLFNSKYWSEAFSLTVDSTIKLVKETLYQSGRIRFLLEWMPTSMSGLFGSRERVFPFYLGRFVRVIGGVFYMGMKRLPSQYGVHVELKKKS